MSDYLKPQVALQDKVSGDYFYPLTTVDQVIMEDGSRLNTRISDLKAGFIYPLASSVIPKGFLLCDGAAYSRTEYPELFAAIGTMYGSGDGSTTFNVPNLQTRVPVGRGEGYELGDIGGEESHTLTVDEMPNHDHNAVLSTHPNIIAVGGADAAVQATIQGNAYAVSGTLSRIAITPTGGSQPHNNMQPYTVVNYIIATGKDTGVSVTDIVTGAQAIPLEVEYGGTGATSAEMARRNLEITPENIGAISMELLWENDNPASSFIAQPVSLILKEDDFVAVEGQEDNTGGATVITICAVGKSGRIYLNANYRQSRGFTVATNGVTFGDGKTANVGESLATNNTVAIPTRIFLFKGVSA